jgi:hypothetical protein
LAHVTERKLRRAAANVAEKPVSAVAGDNCRLRLRHSAWRRRWRGVSIEAAAVALALGARRVAGVSRLAVRCRGVRARSADRSRHAVVALAIDGASGDGRALAATVARLAQRNVADENPLAGGSIVAVDVAAPDRGGDRCQAVGRRLSVVAHAPFIVLVEVVLKVGSSSRLAGRRV